MDNYTLHIRLKKSGQPHDIGIHRAMRLNEVARVMIREGHVVTGYSINTGHLAGARYNVGTRHFGKG